MESKKKLLENRCVEYLYQNIKDKEGWHDMFTMDWYDEKTLLIGFLYSDWREFNILFEITELEDKYKYYLFDCGRTTHTGSFDITNLGSWNSCKHISVCGNGPITIEEFRDNILPEIIFEIESIKNNMSVEIVSDEEYDNSMYNLVRETFDLRDIEFFCHLESGTCELYLEATKEILYWDYNKGENGLDEFRMIVDTYKNKQK